MPFHRHVRSRKNGLRLADPPLLREDGAMTDTRAFLLDALRRAASDGTVTFEEFHAAIPDPRGLDQVERLAWERLSRWVDDGDIRARDASYADVQRRQITEALDDLEAVEAGHLPSEVARGEHRAWHVPLIGCLAIGAILASLVWFYR